MRDEQLMGPLLTTPSQLESQLENWLLNKFANIPDGCIASKYEYELIIIFMYYIKVFFFLAVCISVVKQLIAINDCWFINFN